MHLRPATTDDLGALLAFPLDPHLAGVEPDRLQEEVQAGRMRWSWTWLAEEEDGTVVGRALWWGRPDGTTPLTLDCLHVLDRVEDRPALAAGLLRAAHSAFATADATRPPEYQLTLPPHWRASPATVEAVSWRVRAAAVVGLSEQLERLRFEWTPESPAPGPSRRLHFRAGDEQEFLDLFQRCAVDTLDVTTRRSLAVVDPAAQARDDYAFYLSCPGDRDWWRVATTPAGEPVGFVVPSATPYSRNVGYLGVLPAHRGLGLVDDLLGEVTRFHAAAGAQRTTATTDVTNTPMAAAFERAGYRVTETRLVLEASGAAT
ncbi:GNAT family N-acetyltransferase [Kineococcus sp. NPDC059986]|uniref:GNAT family N-acetyltransferase n=1 Tax=Kineococcus sp. NPDC059986 TaxID=3155538 RepID=UPI00344F2617